MKLSRWLSEWFTRLVCLEKLPRIEDGEIVSCDDGLYRKCPECEQLVPQCVEMRGMPDEMNKFMENEEGKLYSLIDPRHMVMSTFNTETNKSRLLVQCRICGMALRDKEGDLLYQ